jgi:phosphoglycolate phosphatase-like HAD superfamily hydrolase
MKKRNVVLFDLDHTLMDASRRDHMIPEAMHTGRWDAYHASSAEDEMALDAVELLEAMHYAGYNIIGLTARPEKWRTISEERLKKANIWHLFDDLLMRPDDEYRPSAQLKIELAERRFGSEISESVLFIIDDHPEVCDAFQKAGVTALQIKGRSYNNG